MITSVSLLFSCPSQLAVETINRTILHLMSVTLKLDRTVFNMVLVFEQSF